MRSRLVSATGLGLLCLALFVSPAGALPSNCSQSASTVSCTYTGAGTYTFTVPVGVSSLDVTAVGAAGGTGPSGALGGQGASVEDTAVPVTSNQALGVVVGGVGGRGDLRSPGAPGTPGGGGGGGDYPNGNPDAEGDGGGGGGYSGLFDPSSTPLAIAGGGGGGATDARGGTGDTGSGGGAGGSPPSQGHCTAGGGGTSTKGGAGGTPLGGAAGSPGASLAGGQGGASDGGGDNSGGGGGGGYFGGGGGGSDAEYGCGGGGGSSFGVTGLTNEVNTSAAASVTITYTLPKAGTSTSVSCAPNPVVVGQATQCTATVSDTSSTPSTPTGSVSFGSNSSGSFGSGGSCTLSGSGAQVSCAVSYTPAAVGTGAHMIAASYAGDGGHVGSNNSTNVAVTAPNTSLKITYFAAAADRHGDAAAAATFTDTNPPAKVSQYTGTIYWGDNSSPTAASFVRLGQHGFAAAGVHHYAKPGAYTVMITINGIGGASAQKTTKVTVPRN